MSKPIFRPTALERLASPEQLDQLMPVTSPRLWLALLALAGLLTALGLWSVFDRVPVQVQGRGVLISGGQMLPLAAPVAGQIETVLIQPGDAVQAGQVIATLQPAGDLTAPSVELHSLISGQVVEVAVARGAVVSVGTVLATLEDSSQPLVAVIYVPAAAGPQLQPGMGVEVSPEGVSRDAYGFLRGVVESVAAYPASTAAMYAVLANDQLIDAFNQNGALLAVRVSLEGAPTGAYVWSAASAPARGPAERDAGHGPHHHRRAPSDRAATARPMTTRRSRLWPSRSLPKRVRTNTVLQMEAVECGAASLAMVLDFHGRVVPLEELRLACGVSRDGTKASNLVKAARSYGLAAKGYSLEPARLKRLPLPLIVFWNFNHYLVVEGFGPGRVYLNDPAAGRRVVTQAEFDEAFTGVTLVFEPEPGFVRAGRRRSLRAALQPRLAGLQSALLFVLLAGLLLAVPGLVVPALVRVFIDDYLALGNAGWAGAVVVGLGLAGLLTGLITWLQQAALLRLESRLALSSASGFLWHILQLPYEFFTQRFGGEVGWRVTLNDQVANLLSERLAITLVDLSVMVVLGVVMFWYNPLLALVSVGCAALNLLALRVISERRVSANQRLLQEQGKQLGAAMNGLQMIETLKATGAEADFFARWAGYQAKAENSRQGLKVATELLNAVPTLLTALNAALILSLGAGQVIAGALTIGGLVGFQVLAAAFLAPVNTLVQLGSALQETHGHLDRLDDVLHYPLDPALSAPPEDVLPVRPAGYLELRHLTFGYSRIDPALLQDFNLQLKPGLRVAVVGSSGSGKSTLARLVTGLYQPWAGEILLDGRPAGAWPRQELHSALGYVSQDIHLFAGTVRDNLTLWDQTVPEANLIQAARDAGIHDDIVVRPGGYDSVVAEDGRNFSGGQRQRLEIARALVNAPTLLVLDEATSALDAVTEAHIDAALRRRGCACLIIAHRLSTIRDCDEIIVLERGTIVERGTHAGLMQLGGVYTHLIAAA